MSMRDSIAAARIGEPRQNAEGATVFEFKFDPEDPTFAGHFPGHPILPGVFQLEMVRIAAERVLNCSLSTDSNRDLMSPESVGTAFRTLPTRIPCESTT